MLQPEQLFTQVHADVLPGMTTATPQVLGEYVLGFLPGHLEEIRQGSLTYPQLAAIHADVLSDARQDIMANRDPQQAASTQLDLLFMLGGYLPLGGEAYRVTPPELHGDIRHNAEYFDVPSRMRYEQIIDLNAAEFFRSGIIRTYLPADQPEGRDERDFYIGHFMAEPLVNAAYNAAELLVDSHGLVDQVAVAAFAHQNMREFTMRMKGYGRLDRARFNTFRPYLMQYPEGTRNASGAFIPSVQLLELAMHSPTPRQLEFLGESMPYFPQRSQAVIGRLITDSLEGRNVVSMIESGELKIEDDARQELVGVAEQLMEFKYTHMGITKKQVPEAIDGKINRNALNQAQEASILESGEVGTAGFNIRNVLTNGYARAQALRDALEMDGAK